MSWGLYLAPDEYRKYEAQLMGGAEPEGSPLRLTPSTRADSGADPTQFTGSTISFDDWKSGRIRRKATPYKVITYIRSTPKVGRNAPCPCMSGRKYKQCCINN